MKLEIKSPDKKIFSGEVTLIQLPGSDGSFEILNNHAPMIAALGPGRTKIQDANGKMRFFEIKGGVVEVKDNNIIVLAD